MDKIKILVACHKPGPVYQDEVYTPIHVGRAISKYQDEMADMIGDDSGDNISEKNLMYCELTAQYWAWKNLHNVEYVGFCHYQRYFKEQLVNQIPSILSRYDVVLIKETLWSTLESNMVRYISWEDVTIFMKVLKKHHPEYEDITLKYLYGNILYSKNMMICRKKLFDEYAEWLFPLLAECENYIKPSSYSRGRRALAYLGEYFMAVYMLYHHCRIYETDVVGFPSEKKNMLKDKIKGFFRCLHHQTLYTCLRRPKTFEDYYCYPILQGLAADHIEV